MRQREGVNAILDARAEIDREPRSYLWPITARSDQDAFVTYLWQDRVVLDSWPVTTDSEGYSLDALPGLLPGAHFTLTSTNTEETAP